MNFFKSVFSDEPDSPTSPRPDPDQPTSPSLPHQPDSPDPNPWTFGSLLTTLHAKSEWINTYRKDIEEFGSGLKKETQLIRDVVMDLPDTIDATASKAQLSLEKIGTTLDSIGSIGSQLWNSTAEVVSRGKDSILVDNDDVDVRRSSFGRYSRFDSQLRGIQGDVGTYVKDPDDVDEFLKWKNGFDLGGKSEEIDGLLKGNEIVSEVYNMVVCNGDVEHDLFWLRYFYRVHKLVLAENARAELVKRAISKVDDEDLSWDVDDDEDGDVGSTSKVVQDGVESRSEGVEVECRGDVEVNDGGDEGVNKCEEGKESDVSVVSTQPSQEEDDMGWDEIEDVGSDDEKKGSNGEGANKDELRKRLSVVVGGDDDEDLSWDIEDDD